MVPLRDILAVYPTSDPLLLRPFLGTPELGWKVAWSDRMVSLFTPLFVGVIVLMVGSIINIFVGSTAGMLAISVAAIGIFSAYMLYDLKQIVDGGETNYISATLALYLDIFNVFQSLLALLGIFGGERD